MLIDLVVTLVILGVALYLIQLIPMDDTIRQLIRVVIIVAVLLWLLTFFTGYHHGFTGYWRR